MIYRLCILLSFFLHQHTCSNHSTSYQSPKQANNIILLIGDGMGLGHITAGLYSSDKPLHLERFKHLGLAKTHSANQLITDSAAAATAIACGQKTRNEAIGVDAQEKPLTSILKLAQQQHKKTGLISSTSIVHATPAAFVANMNWRKKYDAIALQYLDVPTNILIGGGKHYFNERKDGLNLLDSLQKRGYQLFKELADAQVTNAIQSYKWAVLLGKRRPKATINGRGDFLPDATQLALQHLNNRKGFFLMVEGAQIDYAGHQNFSTWLIAEMLDFDKTVGRALDFAEADGNTLVIVTADHETGGYAINDNILSHKKFDTKFTTDYHTGTMVPVFAYGPGAEKFNGIYENTELFYKMKQAYGFE